MVIGDEDPLGTFIFRTTGFNSIRTSAARLQYFKAVSGNRLACMPLELRLRGKSTRQSHGTPIYYVDITLREGMDLEEALAKAHDMALDRDEFYPQTEAHGANQATSGQLSATGTLSEKLAQRSHRLINRPAPFEDGDAASGASETESETGAATEEAVAAETQRVQNAAANADAEMDATAIEASLQADIAQAPDDAVSDRYGFVPTIEVVDALQAEGWYPVRAQQTRVRDPERRDTTRHLVRFRQDPQRQITVGDSIAELVLTNSYDRSSAYQLDLGLFRLICSNGMVTPVGDMGGIRVRHGKQVVDQNLWRVFNRTQENLLKGGLTGRSASGRHTRTRAIKSVTEDVRLNRALWQLTEHFAALKGQARVA